MNLNTETKFLRTARYLILPAFISVLLSLAGHAQVKKAGETRDYSSYPYWIEMMDDPDANFFEVQKAFYTWWEGRPTHRGDGYKPFKRWEYYWQLRVNPDGSFPEPGHLFREYNRYVAEHPSDGRFKSGQTRWVELGPKTRVDYGGYVGLGRLNAIACHPTDTSIIYVGAPSGGVWKTTDGGRTWVPKSENLPTLGVSEILIHPVRHNDLLVGTGDRDHGDARGIGVLRSPDGGETWELYNNGMGERTVGMMARHETNPDIILAATNGGIYKTTDGGLTWVNKSNISANYKDIKFKPGDMNIAYASSTGGTGFYRSENGGETWQQVSKENGVPEGGRIVIGVSRAVNTMVYIVAGAAAYQGCFVSTDEGRTFTAQSTSPNILGWAPDGSDDGSQAWYDLAIFVDPDNVQVIHVGGINLWRSDNGGKTWKLTGHWVGSGADEVHADQHAFGYNPINKRLYAGNDGGIYYTNNKGLDWVEITEGLGIGQIYKLGVSATNAYKTVTGFQDNGSATWTGSVWMTTGGGDGMECAVDPTDYQYSYTTLYYGSITQHLFNSANKQVGGEGVGGIDETGAWVTPFIIHKEDGKVMLAGYKNVWLTSDLKHPTRMSWKKISNNLAGRNDVFITTLEQSAADLNMLFAVRADRRLFRTGNFNAWPVAWRDLSAGLPVEAIPSDIKCHPFDPMVVYMTLNRRIYKSVDKGESWSDISGTLPDIWLFSIAFDQTTEEGLYLGTDAGVFYRASGENDWVLYNNGLPASVRVTELEIYYDHLNRNNSRIRAATYGRGLWEAGLAPENPLLAPVFLSATTSGNNISLTWNAPFYPQHVTGYKILRNGTWWDTSEVPYYTDDEVEREVSYVYQVVALYEGGTESAGSNRVMAIIADPALLPYSRDFETGTSGWNANFFHNGWQYGSSDELKIPGRIGKFFGISGQGLPSGTPVSDYLFSPPFDLASQSGSTVTLRLTYACNDSSGEGRLAAVFRTSPDSSWTIFHKFDPEANDWKWNMLDMVIPEEALTSTTQIGFRYFNAKAPDGGAAIDDIRIFAGTAGLGQSDKSLDVKIFPNPSSGRFSVEMTNLAPGSFRLRIFNMAGQSVHDQQVIIPIGKSLTDLDLSSRPNGIYTLLIQGPGLEVIEKFTIH